MEIFSLVGPRMTRFDRTPLLSGEWFNLDFGNTDVPGVTKYLKQAAYSSWYPRLVGLRYWATQRDLVPQSRLIPVLDMDNGVHTFCRVMFRVRTKEQIWQKTLA